MKARDPFGIQSRRHLAKSVFISALRLKASNGVLWLCLSPKWSRTACCLKIGNVDIA